MDDEEDVREAMRHTLVAWGAHPLLATDVAEALALCAGTAPDAMVIDYRLRDHDGLAAIAHLTRAFGRGIPVVIVSGESSNEHLARLDASGLPLLLKPVAPARLRADLAHAMRPATTDTSDGKVSAARPA